MVDQPGIMAIGDSMYQGVRSLSFTPNQAPFSPPAQVARALGMRMVLPDLQHPLLFDLEAELRKGGLGSLALRLTEVCTQNLAAWPLDRPWSVHGAFDNVAIGGADFTSLRSDSYDTYINKIPQLVATLQQPGVASRVTAAGELWFALNTCYTLNPTHAASQRSWTQLDHVEQRQPRIVLVNIGSNEGLFRSGFLGQLQLDSNDFVAKARTLGDRLSRLPARVERIVFNSLVRPRTIPNLMPDAVFENTDQRGQYFEAYGPRAYSHHQNITAEQLQAFDQKVAQLNADVQDVLRSADPRFVFADLYPAGDPTDGKHWWGRGLQVRGHFNRLSNKPITPLPVGYYGGLAGLDNMHPTVPGYALIADTVLQALGSAQRTDKDLAFASDTLLTNLAGLQVLVAQQELSWLSDLGVFRSSQQSMTS